MSGRAAKHKNLMHLKSFEKATKKLSFMHLIALLHSSLYQSYGEVQQIYPGKYSQNLFIFFHFNNTNQIPEVWERFMHKSIKWCVFEEKKRRVQCHTHKNTMCKYEIERFNEFVWYRLSPYLDSLCVFCYNRTTNGLCLDSHKCLLWILSRY